MIFFLLLLISMQIAIAQDLVLVPFFTSMEKSENFEKNALFSDEKWQIVFSLYTTFRLQHQKCKRHNQNSRIPKIIHQIWLGSEVPEDCKRYMHSIKALHPDWEYRLWTEKEIDELALVNQDVYEASQNYGEKSDIARYEILYRYGGVYLDTDFECIQPLDILHNHLDFYTGIGYSKEVLLFNGLIGSAPGHPILKQCIEDITAPAIKNSDILESTGPTLFTRSFFKSWQKNTNNGKVVAFPVTYFYAWPAYMRFDHRRVPACYLEKESMALHYWRTSWVVPES